MTHEPSMSHEFNPSWHVGGNINDSPMKATSFDGIETIDSWIKRDQRLVPLTGAIPFNAEPSLRTLEAGGVITPAEIHYVRNHGPVPHLKPSKFELSLEFDFETEQQKSERIRTEQQQALKEEEAAEAKVEEMNKHKSAPAGKEPTSTQVTSIQPESSSHATQSLPSYEPPEKQHLQPPTKKEPKKDEKGGREPKESDSLQVKEIKASLSLSPEVEQRKLDELARKWNLAALKKLPKHDVVATLVCDGLRRKEVNVLEHTKGFNTGAGSIGTSKWTGVRVSDLIRDACKESQVSLDELIHNLPFINFDGSDEPARGTYATSLSTAYACDPVNDVILAYEQNDQPLLPDHGAPLRVVVPGNVGGRWIKWLKRITLSKKMTDSVYHFEDNRRYPNHVTIADLNTSKWYQQSEYSLYEMNVNSAIMTPAHQECLVLQLGTCGENSEESKTHTEDGLRIYHATDNIRCTGFAYAGGGRRILWVEVSTDGGETFKNAKLHYTDLDGQKKEETEEFTESLWRLRHKCWSWCLWEIEIPACQFIGEQAELVVRATDEAWNGQSERLEWNATGMMNNCYYRVKVNGLEDGKQPCQQLTLTFSHPVQPGSYGGGWMVSGQTMNRYTTHQHKLSYSYDYLGSLPRAGPLIGLAAHKAHKLISRREVKEHQSAGDLWFIMDQQVFDVSTYMEHHPGGRDSLLTAARALPSDVSRLFRSVHAKDAFEITGRFLIGVIADDELIDALVKHGTIQPSEVLDSSSEKKDADRKNKATAPRRFFADFSADGEGGGSGHVLDDNGMEQLKEPFAKVNLPSGKDRALHPHRRPNWHEHPDPDRVHHLTGEVQFPRTIAGAATKFLLHATGWCEVELIASCTETHDVIILTLRSAADGYRRLGLTTGQHLLLGAKIGNEWVVRPYTPIWPASPEEEEMAVKAVESPPKTESPPTQFEDVSPKETHQPDPAKHAVVIPDTPAAHIAPIGMDEACFQLLVKVYRPSGLLPGGKMSQYLATRPLGDRTLKVKGPVGYVLYEGCGYFNIHTISVQVRYVNLIGGGTGITPLFQLMKAMLLLGGEEEAKAGVQIRLIFANKSKEDILLEQEIKALAERVPERFKVVHVLSAKSSGTSEKPKSPSAKKSDSTSPSASSSKSPVHVPIEYGHVNGSLFRRYLLPPSSETLTFVCGPPPMVEATNHHLCQLGFNDQQIVEF